MPLPTWLQRIWAFPWTRRFVKNAILAASSALAPIWQDPKDYNLVTWHGVGHVAAMVGGVILSREMTFVVIPFLMKYYRLVIEWAQTPDPDDAVLPK